MGVRSNGGAGTRSVVPGWPPVGRLTVWVGRKAAGDSNPLGPRLAASPCGRVGMAAGDSNPLGPRLAASPFGRVGMAAGDSIPLGPRLAAPPLERCSIIQIHIDIYIYMYLYIIYIYIWGIHK